VQIRTVLADDDEPALRLLERQLQAFPDVKVVGQARDGAEAVEQVERLRPDLLFLDIEMPKLTGLQVLQRLEHRPLVVVITAHERYWKMLLETEAICCLNKPVDGSQLAAAMERVRNVIRIGGRIAARTEA
jgi:two-component system, LytTR family, response regulator